MSSSELWSCVVSRRMGPSLHVVQYIAYNLSKQTTDYKHIDNTEQTH